MSPKHHGRLYHQCNKSHQYPEIATKARYQQVEIIDGNHTQKKIK